MFKVGSYNIQKSIGLDARRRPERTLEVIREMNCDVVALQEADKRFGRRSSTLCTEQIAEQTDYEVVPLAIRKSSLGWHGNAILVRKGIEIIDQKRLELPVLEPRGAVTSDLNINGIKIRVGAMHLSVVSRFRKRQIFSLMAQLHANEHDVPTILMGDLNEWRDGARSIKMFSPDFQVTSPGKTFPSPMPLARLDRIVTSRELTVEGAGVHTSKTARIASDHLPVWAEISVQNESCAERAKPSNLPTDL